MIRILRQVFVSGKCVNNFIFVLLQPHRLYRWGLIYEFECGENGFKEGPGKLCPPLASACLRRDRIYLSLMCHKHVVSWVLVCDIKRVVSYTEGYKDHIFLPTALSSEVGSFAFGEYIDKTSLKASRSKPSLFDNRASAVS